MSARTKELTLRCCWCTKQQPPIMVDPDDYDRWQKNGELIQNAMPYLTADEREMLISRTCGTCWESMFGDED